MQLFKRLTLSTGSAPRLGALTATALLLVLTTPFAKAQSADGDAKVLEAMQQRLALSDAQVEQVQPIIAAGKEQQRQILASYGIDLSSEGGPRLGRRDMMSMRDEMQAARKDMLGELGTVLSDAQLREFEKLQQELSVEQRNALRSRMKGR
ncbi:MAG: hypothetical protein AAGD86_04025 [Pseudomonadota bacterium]